LDAIYRPMINRGGQLKTTATVNQPLTVAVALRGSPRLIY
jgi:hypothetical protein